jgi:hypothetical protein
MADRQAGRTREFARVASPPHFLPQTANLHLLYVRLLGRYTLFGGGPLLEPQSFVNNLAEENSHAQIIIH